MEMSVSQDFSQRIQKKLKRWRQCREIERDYTEQCVRIILQTFDYIWRLPPQFTERCSHKNLQKQKNKTLSIQSDFHRIMWALMYPLKED